MNNASNKKLPSFVFFGTSNYSVQVLEELKAASLLPSLIVTTADKPQGRKLLLTPPPVKTWAMNNSIPFLQPENLKDSIFKEELQKQKSQVFIVIAYGKIIPQEIIDIPAHGTLNIHASLLPKHRGASPIESAILQDSKKTGVTIMQIDDKMDHGPIIAQEVVEVQPWPPKAEVLGKALVHAGAELLIQILPEWIAGTIASHEQDHAEATYTKKIEKQDGEINLSENPYMNFRKIQAFHHWPTAYFFITDKKDPAKQIRVIIKEAAFTDGKLEILTVLPEGKKEMSYKDFAKGYLPLIV